MNKSVILPKIPTLPNEPAAAMRGTVVRRQVGATKHGNENRKYDLLSPAHAAAGVALGVNEAPRRKQRGILEQNS